MAERVGTASPRGPRPARADDLRIAGISAFSSVDWPGRLVATLFLQGCPWDCHYCHNPSLINPRAPGALTWQQVLDLLDERAGLLDGVVFSGGEPTMQRALVPAMAQVRERGFGVGLHTAGSFPLLMARALPHADWVGLDIKAAAGGYAEVTGRERSGELAWRSLELLLAHAELRRATGRAFDYEVRTTAHPATTDGDRLCSLGDSLAGRGVDTWVVQRFHETGAREPARASGAASVPLDALPRERFARFTVR